MTIGGRRRHCDSLAPAPDVVRQLVALLSLTSPKLPKEVLWC